MNSLSRVPVTSRPGALSHLRFLSLADNPITQLDEVFLRGLNSLRLLNISGIQLSHIDSNSLASLTMLTGISFSSFAMCRYAPMVRTCHPLSDGISSVENMLDSAVLRVAIWIVAMTTCTGSAFVIACRMLFREDKNVHSLFVKNLAAADFMMGVYLFLIATHDSLYRGEYNRHAFSWMSAWTCHATGLLAVASCEVSALVLAALSVDCCLAVSRPYLPPSTSMSRAVGVLAGAWVVGVGLAVVAPASSSAAEFYGANGVCLPLHVHNPYLPGWQFSAVIFLGVNAVAVVTIAVSYAIMCISVHRTQLALAEHKNLDRRDTSASVNLTLEPRESVDRDLAKRLFLIVLTNVMCWIPVMVVKLLAFSHVHISDQLYGWLTVFILPINSALNPLIYTITTPSFKNKVIECCPLSARPDTDKWRRLLTCGCPSLATATHRHSSAASTNLSLLFAGLSTRRSQSVQTGSRHGEQLPADSEVDDRMQGVVVARRNPTQSPAAPVALFDGLIEEMAIELDVVDGGRRRRTAVDPVWIGESTVA